ncbi:hypothetical protein NDU88_002434, partial [Pleurodeles waltl]
MCTPNGPSKTFWKKIQKFGEDGELFGKSKIEGPTRRVECSQLASTATRPDLQ